MCNNFSGDFSMWVVKKWGGQGPPGPPGSDAYECISLLSVPAKERSLPSVEQIKEDMLAGRGGVSEHIHETVSRSTGLYNILEPRQSLLTTTL